VEPLRPLGKVEWASIVANVENIWSIIGCPFQIVFVFDVVVIVVVEMLISHVLYS
jgi:hypothetical protein